MTLGSARSLVIFFSSSPISDFISMENENRKLRLLARKQILFRRLLTGLESSSGLKPSDRWAARIRRLIKIEMDLAALESLQSKSG